MNSRIVAFLFRDIKKATLWRILSETDEMGVIVFLFHKARSEERQRQKKTKKSKKR